MRSLRLEQSQLAMTTLDESDLPVMMALEQTASRHPWSQGQYLTCMGAEYRFLGAWYGDALVGFIVDWRMLDEGHLMNLCVHGQFQQQGIGRYLLRYWLASTQREGMATLTLEVRESNQAAYRLYAGEGFEDQGSRPGYYRTAEGTEAARVMSLGLSPVRAGNG
ncbi:ribosomal-protein-alanine N-acetyltransferase [Halovibrio salipaludis]|uniref:Ribosomal-protein-alanine N-acetyltransferase n=1 Tax=Halovibrio salipaludis TaxID=2032626 RepID=A0A2A2F5Z2_9GAMM|nr:ribosomal protein S18-alanine N-acetyltransferase [Halovibrio salipaludis]PAU79963.1 ribosomal-protein-alanine N-acetyltransferase [Halovibrio salipaludis]